MTVTAKRPTLGDALNLLIGVFAQGRLLASPNRT